MQFNVVAFAFVAVSAIPSAAFAADPLVVKSNYPGYVHPAWLRTETCEIFADRVVITRRFGALDDGSFTTSESRAVTVSDGIEQVIANAAGETLGETPNGLCDGPSTQVSARRAGERGEELVLFNTGGCGSPRQERDGVFTKMLRDLVDVYCPKTNDNGGDRP